MGRRVVLAAVLAVGACGCDGHTADAIDGEAGDAAGISPDFGGPFPGPPSGGGCPELALFPGLSLGPDSGLFLDPDSGSIPSLFNLQLDAPELCGFVNGEPATTESQPCAGTIEVFFADGPNSGVLLFDAKTGELEAIGQPYDPGQCFGVRPGFVFPTHCENADFDAGGWWPTPGTPLCTGHAEACAPSGCDTSCPADTHDVSSVVDGCTVWQCCVPDDAGPATDAAADASAE
jgi:hypothetical protein